MNNSFDYLFKFILVGDSGVGKSCLLNRFVQGKFKYEHDPTLGVQFGCKIITMDGVALKVQIWDTAGQQSFKSITRSYYKGSVAAFLIFDISRRSSFENITKWFLQVKNYSHENIQVAVIGNKLDLKSERQMSFDEGLKYSKQNNCEYFQTSALTGQNVNQPFQFISRKILLKIQNKLINPESQNSFGIKTGKKKKQIKKQNNLNINKQQFTNFKSKNSCQC